MLRPVTTTRQTWVTIALLASVVGCGNLTCDNDKKQSIVRQNAGVDFAKAKAFGSAEKELEAATVLDKENHAAAYSLGQVYAEQKKWDKAVDAFSLATQANDIDPMYHYKLGQALYETAKLDPAKKEFDRALQLNNKLFKAHWYAGRILAQQAKLKEAAAEWSAACKLNPGFGKPFIDLGRLYYQWDYLHEAVQVLTLGAQYARDSEDRTNIYYYLGMAHDGLKEYDKAAEAYLAAIQERKENVEARLQLGMAYANAGKKVEAKKYLEEFVKMGGGNSPFNIQAAHDRLAKMASE